MDLILSVTSKKSKLQWIAGILSKRWNQGVSLWFWFSICEAGESVMWSEHGKPGFCLLGGKRWQRGWRNLKLEGIIELFSPTPNFTHEQPDGWIDSPFVTQLVNGRLSWQWGSCVFSNSLLPVMCSLSIAGFGKLRNIYFSTCRLSCLSYQWHSLLIQLSITGIGAR